MKLIGTTFEHTKLKVFRLLPTQAKQSCFYGTLDRQSDFLALFFRSDEFDLLNEDIL